jgi:hypothetical protein
MLGDGDEGPDGSVGGRLRRGKSVALIADALALVYADRHLVPARLTGWDFSDVFGDVANLAVPVAGFVLASPQPANHVGWLFLVAGLGPGLGGFANAYGLHALLAAPGSFPAGQKASGCRLGGPGPRLRAGC